MKAKNFTTNSGNAVANQFIITDGDRTVFQSYNSVIAERSLTGVKLDARYWNYSATTGKYRNKFLGESVAETRKKIAIGEYELVDLNK